MSLQTSLTQFITQELLCKVITHLSSISATLSPAQIAAAVEGQLPKSLTFNDNNDIGLCVTRLLAKCSDLTTPTTAALEAAYPTLRADDAVIDHTLNQLAEGIARSISTPLYELRVSLPQEAKALSAKITANLPTAAQTPEQAGAMTLFSWGKLEQPAVRALAMATAQDKLDCFKSGTTRLSDSTTILRAVAAAPFAVVPQTPAVQSVLVKELTTAIAAIPDPMQQTTLTTRLPLVVEALLNPRAHQRQLVDLAQSVAPSVVAANAATVVATVDSTEDVLLLVSSAILNKLDEAALPTQALLDNITTMRTNMILLRAALLHHKYHTLHDCVLLNPTTIHAPAFEAFCAQGGTRAMLQAHLDYLGLNEQSLSLRGASAEAILRLADHAGTAVQRQATRLTAKRTAMAVAARQQTLETTLNRHYKDHRASGRYAATLDAIHEHHCHTAMATLLTKSLDDIALEYLIALRNDAMLTHFYKNINRELTALVQTQTEIATSDINTATCKAVGKTVLSVITDRFAKAA